MNAKQFPSWSALTVLALIVASCGTLDPTGVYKGDKALYGAELATVTAKDVIHAFVKWELENEQALAQYPEIHKAATLMRREAKGWVTSAIAVRDAYEANPTEENRTKLQQALTTLRAAMTEAQKHMNKVASSR